MGSVSAEPVMYLPQIIAHVRGVVAERKGSADVRATERAAAEHTPRGFARALRAKAAAGPAVIPRSALRGRRPRASATSIAAGADRDPKSGSEGSAPVPPARFRAISG